MDIRLIARSILSIYPGFQQLERVPGPVAFYKSKGLIGSALAELLRIALRMPSSTRLVRAIAFSISMSSLNLKASKPCVSIWRLDKAYSRYRPASSALMCSGVWTKALKRKR